MLKKMLSSIIIGTSLFANAQINTANINHTLIGISNYNLDLNNDGLIDYSFEILSLGANGYGARVLTLNNSLLLDNSTFGYVDALSLNDSVSGHMGPGPGVLGTFNSAGQFAGQGNKYLGVQLVVGAQLYNGWILLNCSANRDTLKIISSGYNSISNGLINAGQSSVTGIDETIDNMNFIKSDNTIFIANHSNDITSYTIYNTLGQVTKSSVLQNNSIDVSDLELGIYFLVVKNKNNKSTVYKFIK